MDEIENAWKPTLHSLLPALHVLLEVRCILGHELLVVALAACARRFAAEFLTSIKRPSTEVAPSSLGTLCVNRQACFFNCFLSSCYFMFCVQTRWILEAAAEAFAIQP